MQEEEERQSKSKHNKTQKQERRTVTARGREQYKRFRTGETDISYAQDRREGEFLNWRARENTSHSAGLELPRRAAGHLHSNATATTDELCEQCTPKPTEQ